MNLPLPHFSHALTFVQANILVDAGGRVRIAGLGEVSIPSAMPGVDVDRFSHNAAPELFNSRCFGFVGTESTKTSDTYAFGIIAWEVSRMGTNLSGRNPKSNGIIPRFSQGGFHSPIRTRLQGRT